MTGGPRGTLPPLDECIRHVNCGGGQHDPSCPCSRVRPEPLDLSAVEARLEWYDAPPPVGQTKHYTTEAITLAGDVRALLAHVRALRAALDEQMEYLRRLKHRAEVRGGPDISAIGIAEEAIEHIATVLAAATDDA